MAKQKKKIEIPVYNENHVHNYVLLAAFAIFLIFFTTFKITGDDDVFWHMATGRYVLETKSVPDKDIFGFVSEGTKWMPFEWGWDVITYTVYSISGFTGLSILRTLLILAVFWIFLLILRKFSVSDTVSIIFFIILAFAIIDRLSPRPHLMTYMFFSLVLYIIVSYRYSDRKNYKILFFLPLIFLIWANTHMGIIAGIFIISVYIFCEVVIYFFPARFSSKEIPALGKKELYRLIAIYAVSVLVMFINPNGVATYIYAYEHTKMKMLVTVNEWMSPFGDNYSGNFVTVIYKIFLFSGILILFYSYRKKDLFPAVLFLFFAPYSVRAMRFTVDYVLILFVFLVVTYNYFLTKIKNLKFILFVEKKPHLKIILICLFLFLSYLVSDSSLYLKHMNYYRVTGIGINGEFIPVQMFQFIKENNIQEIGEKPYNHFGTGGFFIWNFPGKKNFIDSRNLSDEIFYKYDTLMRKFPGFEKKFNDYGFDYVIYLDPDFTHWEPARLERMKEGLIISYLTKSEDWKLIWWDDKSFLYVKNLPKFQDIISKYDYKYLTPFYFPFYDEKQKALINKAINEDKETLKAELKRKMNEDPGSGIMRALFSNFGNKLNFINN
jgi:hypothetical protein